MMLEMAQKAPTDDFLRAVVEAFSMSNNIHNWMDFDNFMSKKLRGETTETGVKKTGATIRELQGVMVNSVLSGPKTPLRAIMGTSTATFLRPMSQLIGGAMQYVGSGFNDPQTMRSALAQLHSFTETVPEATQYFFSRLNSYWGGDLSTYKSRLLSMTPKTMNGQCLATGLRNEDQSVTRLHLVSQTLLVLLIKRIPYLQLR